MSHHCPFPVRSTNSRSSYYTGTAPGLALCLALVAALLGYASVSHAAPSERGHGNENRAAPAATFATSQPYLGWAGGRLLVAPRAGLPAGEFDQALKSFRDAPKAMFGS